jgi:hypothetical protein
VGRFRRARGMERLQLQWVALAALVVVLAGAVVLAGLAVGVASAYGLLSLLLAGGYALVALGLGQLLGQDSSLIVAAATLAVAAVFQPARRRVQAAVDRRFNRRRHDAGRVIEAFGARLRDQVDLDTLTAEVIAVADHTMQPTSASLWLRPGQAGSGPARPRPSSG